MNETPQNFNGMTTHRLNKLLENISEVVRHVMVRRVGVELSRRCKLKPDGQVAVHVSPVGHIGHHHTLHHLGGRLNGLGQTHEHL